MAALGLGAATNDMSIAREALRDGLWSVAREHALSVDSDEARRLVLESYAQEGNWNDLLSAYATMGERRGEAFAYYRAAALARTGNWVEASNCVAHVVVTNGAYAQPMARLKAEIARASGDEQGARAVLEKDGGSDVETKLMLAELQHDDAQRRQLWKEVVLDTNASERVRAIAAAGLGDLEALRAATQAKKASVRRFAALKLGLALARDGDTFAEGAKMIDETVRDKPDADGAREAFLELAGLRLGRGEHAEAAKAYADALEIWPELTKDAALFEGRGWAYLKLGRTTEALDEFRKAEELYDDVPRKAAVAVRAADALAQAGREQEATAAYQKVCDTYPGTEAAKRVADVIRLRELEEQGRALYRACDFTGARKVFEQLAKEDPARRERLDYYGVLCFYGAGDDERAEASARALASQAKDAKVRADATRWLAKFEFNRERWRESGKGFADYADMVPKAEDAPMALVWSARAALADKDFKSVISNAAKLVARYPSSPARASAMLAQGEALVELARFDEAVLVLDRAALVSGLSERDRLSVNILRADALFAMGADNPARYRAALEAYGKIRATGTLLPDLALSVAFKTAKTLEKLGRVDDAVDAYYTQVVLAYRMGRLAGTNYDENARAAFARAAFRLADIYESRGRVRQAVNILGLVRDSDVPAADEAAKRIERMMQKGMP